MLDRAKEAAEGDASFAAWLTVLDTIVEDNLGVSLFDLEDMLLRDSFDAGETPEQCISGVVYPSVLENYGEEYAALLEVIAA